MKINQKYLVLLCCLAFKANALTHIVAAENFYGELAHEIGGKYVKVESIINNPDADPHLFTTSPNISKSISQASIIIYSGASYDPWIKQMIAAVDDKKVTIINVAHLVNVTAGQNPHIWYKSDTFPLLARVLADKLSVDYPQDKNYFRANLTQFLTGYNKIISQTKLMKLKYNGIPVTATEPVFGYMADNLGLKMLGNDFQWKVMNNTEPSPKMIAAYEELITRHKIRVLFYNSQVSDEITKNMKNLALKHNIPVVGVTETMPINMSINNWLFDELISTQHALENANISH